MHEYLLPMIVAAFVAACASLLGSFAILKRMALVGDALSHVALPGIAIALMLRINPFLGGAAVLVVTVIGIWLVEYKSSLSLDTIVGVFFTASLAIGALIMPEQELIEALFGNIMELGAVESALSIVMSIALIVAIIFIHKRLTLSMVSADMAHSIGIKTRRLELAYLLIFAFAVTLGIRFVGALLMGSLVIIPAASAKNIAKSLNAFMSLSVIFGVAAAAAGIYVSYTRALPPGPVFILISSMIFIASLAVRQARKAA
ncbi:MAG: metal ABC transporter permease [Deltaproteobacteria bacterium]|nr:metal ABC transporter permease [Deltaproteobacteria bacterium]MBI5810171.1 metal ABC transporter permease [Deltaproteobacteria bacterium]